MRKVNCQFSGSVVHPLTFFCILSFIFNIDFLLLYEDPELTSLLYEFDFPTTKSDVINGYLVYTYLFICGFFGVVIAYSQKTTLTMRMHKHSGSIYHGGRRQWAFLILIIMIMAASYGVSVLYSTLDVGAARQKVFSDNKWAIMPFLFLMPAMMIFLANYQSQIKLSFFLIIVCLVLFYATGTRGHIIFLGVVSLILLQIRGYKIRKSILILLAPILVVYLVADRYLRRYTGDAANLQEYITQSDGLLRLLFFTGEISMAEVITTITMELNNLDRYPFESFIGFLMIPIPRSLLPFKPFGASAVFTDYVAPTRKLVSGSEIATTGYGDLVMQFGTFFSGFVFLIICYFWCRLYLRVLNYHTYYIMLFLPFLVWWPYLFLRSGIFDVGVKFWYAFILYALYRCLCVFSGRWLPHKRNWKISDLHY